MGQVYNEDKLEAEKSENALKTSQWRSSIRHSTQTSLSIFSWIIIVAYYLLLPMIGARRPTSSDSMAFRHPI